MNVLGEGDHDRLGRDSFHPPNVQYILVQLRMLLDLLSVSELNVIIWRYAYVHVYVVFMSMLFTC